MSELNEMKIEANEWWKLLICIIIAGLILFAIFMPREVAKEENVTLNQKIPKVIDMDIIMEIESSNNPNAISPVGARGICQIMPNTWDECCNRLNVNWDWEEAFNKEKNLKIGTYYINKRIPEMLKYYKIEDNYKNRLMSYNWGIGNVKSFYENKKDIPIETKNYIKKYKKQYLS